MSQTPNVAVSSRWSKLPKSEPDVVFDAADAFRRDVRKPVSAMGERLGVSKANLTLGEPKELGVGGVELAWTAGAFLRALREVAERAERRTGASLGYSTPAGHVAFRDGVTRRLFGADSTLVSAERVATIQTEGATNALHIALRIAKNAEMTGPVWTSSPGWGNYPGVIRYHNLQHKSFPHPHGESGFADVTPLLDALGSQIRRTDTLILQPDGHNPTGWLVPDAKWSAIAEAAKRAGCFVILDFAYDGLIRGAEKDRQAIDEFVAANVDFAVAYSCSKCFGIGGLRLGALSVVCESERERDAVLGYAKNSSVRPVISHPSIIAAEAASQLYRDETLFGEWANARDAMQRQIGVARSTALSQLCQAGVDMPQGGFGPFITLPRDDAPFVAKLRDYGIYTVGGRVFVLVDAATMDYAARGICQALNEVPEPTVASAGAFGTGRLPLAERAQRLLDDGYGSVGPLGGGC